jgi:DHA1 family tetracycline resistance protein-like MFS transporter
VLAGLTGGNISVAQAYITDVTDQQSRTRALGMIGAAFGLGFIFGPALGGLLSTYGFAVPALVAAGLAIVNLGLIAALLPESLTPERRAALLSRARSVLSLGALTAALSRPTVGPLLQIRFVFGFAFVIFQTVFALYAQYRLGLDARATSYILSYVGVLSVVTQAVVIGRLAARFADGTLILGSILTMGLALFAWSVAPTLAVVLVVLAPMSVAGGILNTVLNSALTKSVRPEEIGGMLGIGASVESLTRVLAPAVGGVLLQNLGASAPGVFASIILALLLPYAWRQISRLSLTPPAVALAPVRID